MAGVQGRRVLVVGASAGIGRWSAVRLAQLGADVAVAARRADQLAETASLCGRAHVLTVDVRDPAACEQLVDDAVDRLGGGLDAILYTAGWSPLGELRHTTAETWRAIFEINTIGPQLITTAALAHLASDAIVAFVSSDSVHDPRHSLAPYAASKAALEATLKGWRTEVLGGVRFLKLVVGPTIPTDFGRDFDGPTLMAVFGHWTRQGMRTGYMDATDLGNQIGDLFSACFAHPAISPDEVVFRPVEPEQPHSAFGAEGGVPVG